MVQLSSPSSSSNTTGGSGGVTETNVAKCLTNYGGDDDDTTTMGWCNGGYEMTTHGGVAEDTIWQPTVATYGGVDAVVSARWGDGVVHYCTFVGVGGEVVTRRGASRRLLESIVVAYYMGRGRHDAHSSHATRDNGGNDDDGNWCFIVVENLLIIDSEKTTISSREPISATNTCWSTRLDQNLILIT